MSNPFSDRVSALSGPARDIAPVIPDDAIAMSMAAVALYVETGGTLSVITVAGETRTFSCGDFAIVPVGVTHVLATGTTASGIHAYRI